MKIAQITHVFLPSIGGVEYYVYRLSRDLSNKDEDVEVLTTNFGVNEPDILIYQKFKTIYFHAFPLILRNPFPIGLAWHLIKNEYDVIHCHSILAFTSIIAVLFKKKAKFIITAHGVSPENPKGMLRLAWIVYTPIVKFLCHRTDKIIVLGKRENEKMVKTFKVEPSKISIIPNGIDSLEEPSPDQVESYRKKYGLDHYMVVLFLGRVASNKNPEVLLRSFSIVKEKRKDVKLLFVGPIERQYMQYLQNLAKSLGIEHDILFTGKVNKGEINIYYKLSDIFISLGIWEGIPTTLLEAMYFGIPCIMYNAGSIWDVIEDGKTGFIITKLDANLIAERITVILNNETLREDISRKAKKVIAERYMWNRSFDRIFLAYKS